MHARRFSIFVTADHTVAYLQNLKNFSCS